MTDEQYAQFRRALRSPARPLVLALEGRGLRFELVMGRVVTLPAGMVTNSKFSSSLSAITSGRPKRVASLRGYFRYSSCRTRARRFYAPPFLFCSPHDSTKRFAIDARAALELLHKIARRCSLHLKADRATARTATRP